MTQKIARPSNAALHMVLAAVAAAFFLLALWTPLMQDDLVFMAQSADLSADPPVFSWDAWRGHVALMYAENNGRLANILAPLGAWLMPGWGRALLIGLCAAWVFYIAGRMAFGGRVVWKGVLLMCALSLAAWPWRDRLMLWDYALNYLFASALLLPFLYLFCEKRSDGRGVVVGSMCGFFGAWLHDGSALCMLAAVGTIALSRRLRLSRGQWIMALALLLGTVAVLASPGEWQRASGELGSNSLARNLVISLSIEPLAWLLAVAVLFLLALPSRRVGALRRVIASDNLFIGCLLMTGYSFLMSVMLAPSGRYGWQAGVFASVALFRLWGEAGIRLPSLISRTVVSVVVMVSAISFQRLLWIENEDILSEAGSSEYGTVFRDLLSGADEPLVALRLPATGIWRSAFQMACANALASPSSSKMTAVVPASLASLSEIPATSLFIYNDCLLGTDTVAPFDEPGFLCGPQRAAVSTILLTDSSGVTSPVTFWPYKFRHPFLAGRALVFYGTVPPATIRVAYTGE